MFLLILNISEYEWVLCIVSSWVELYVCWCFSYELHLFNSIHPFFYAFLFKSFQLIWGCRWKLAPELIHNALLLACTASSSYLGCWLLIAVPVWTQQVCGECFPSLYWTAFPIMQEVEVRGDGWCLARWWNNIHVNARRQVFPEQPVSRSTLTANNVWFH